MFPFHLLVCCLRSSDLVVMYGTITLFGISLGLPIERDAWNALFTGYSPSSEWGQNLWLLRWGLGETFIVIDDVPVPAIEMTVPTFWADLVLWLATNPDGCDDGCPQLAYNRVPV